MLTTDSYPRTITLFVNWVCNLECRECWLYGENSTESTWLDDVHRQMVDPALVRSICREAREFGAAPSMSLMGGEPLMHKDIDEIISIVKTECPDIYLDMSTNGTLLSRRADAIAEAGIDIVYVSLDGPNAPINDEIRGIGTFDRVMEGTKALLKVRRRLGSPRVGVNLTVTPTNYESLPELVDLACALELDTISVNFVMFFGAEAGASSRKQFEEMTGRSFLSWRGYLNPGQVQGVDTSALRDSISAAESRAEAKEIELLIAPTRYDAEKKSKYFTSAWAQTVQESSCPKISTQTTVLPNGDVVSCTPFSDTVMGNLYEEGKLYDIWHGERYRQFRRRFHNSLADICMRCCDLNNDMDKTYEIYEACR